MEKNGNIKYIKCKKMGVSANGMKRNKFEIIKGIIGLALCLIAVFGIYYWETYGRIEYSKRDVVVLSESVKALTVITPEHLVIVKRDVFDLISDAIVDPEYVIGKVSKHYIPGRIQLTSEFFEEEGMQPGEGEYIFKMPTDWIASLPSTLRRSDDAFLYPVRGSIGELNEELYKSDLNESADPVKCLKIAFVRNQSNQEVQSVGQSDRLDANSNISSIELIATLEDIDRLNEMREEGYKFIVMYK